MSKANPYHTKIEKFLEISKGLEDRIDVETASGCRRLNRIITLYENKAKCLDHTIHNNKFLIPSLVKKARKQLRDLLDRFYAIYGFELYLENM